ncbi:MAG: hypothetical protein AB1305_02980 [Candidatus Hadarchaeota archaeon]
MTAKEIRPIHDSFRKNCLVTHIVAIPMLALVLILVATSASGKNTLGAMMAIVTAVGALVSMGYRWRKLEYWAFPQWLIKRLRVFTVVVSAAVIIITGIVALLNLNPTYQLVMRRDLALPNPLLFMAAISYLSLSNVVVFVLFNRLQVPEQGILPKIVDREGKFSMYYFYVFLILPIAVGLVFWVGI